MPLDADSLDAVLREGYGFEDEAIVLGRPLDPALEHPRNEHYVQVPLRQLNKHGLIAGATGTGKTKSLQVIAEQLSRAGVPVFLSDLKGDLTGLAEASPGNEHIDARMADLDLPWTPEPFPVELLSLSGESGTPLRVPVSSFGPLLLAKVLDCNETQGSVLQAAFRYADESQLALLDLVDLIELLKFLTSEEGREAQASYGGMSTQTLTVLLRKAMELQTQGGDELFGEPEFDVADLQRTEDGKGVITVLNLVDVQTKPRIFSTFMMWLLAEIYETSPEVGDPDQPKLVFFFDEAHLLFDGASKTLRDSIELTVRMIRSKGVGVFFVTQQPRDLPDDVLAQLGNRVQHALRAYTPQDQKAIKATAATFPVSEVYAVQEALTNLGTGEALVTVLGPTGRPTPTVPTRMVAPVSLMDPVDDATVQRLLAASPLRERYAERVDRESAAEILARKAEERATQAAAHERAKEEADALARREKDLAADRPRGRGSGASRRASTRETASQRMVKNAASSVGREVGRSLVRGILGNLGR
jgi:uncharacterized protein